LKPEALDEITSIPGVVEAVARHSGFHRTRQMNMKDKQQLAESMEEEQIREALNSHWHASAVGDANAEHDIYDDNAICDYPQ
jgi:hypothetical protein